nr:hypothetical protein Hi04_10k_c5801_00013 [uncultured bacterium]
MLIEREEILSLIPHQHSMCLLDVVEEWSARSLCCRSLSHCSPDNPLRRNGLLSALHLVEYGAQATAVHGGLLARERNTTAPPGFLASLRDVRLHVNRIDDIAEPLLVQADVLTSSEMGWMYSFNISAAGRALASGRVSVILMTG